MSAWVCPVHLAEADFSDLLQEYGIKVHFAGRREMLPPLVRDAVNQMETLTAKNTEYVQLRTLAKAQRADDQGSAQRLLPLRITR